MTKRTSVFFSDRALEVLGEPVSLSGRLNEIIDRYDVLVSYARREALELLTPAERKALKVALKSVPWTLLSSLEVTEAVVNRVHDLVLDGKMQDEGEALLDKLRAMDTSKRMALVEWVERG